ncbi:MAG: NADH-quinone oxidoreductase subunit C, partial [bacterium]
TYAPKSNPVIKTITDTFPGGDLYERELTDLLGAKIDGLPNGIRYPLPDGWPEGQYPLRKDWNREMLDIKKEN